MNSTGKFYRKNIRRKLILILLIMTVAVVPTIAQSDCYPNDIAYVAGGLNVRERATTDSQVIATARSGDSFTVSLSQQGEQWCWLKISRGWIAKTSRVRSTAPSNTSPSQSKKSQQPVQERSNVNNCCFVDRQCMTDEEWVNGYNAYQNNQCPAPSLQQQSTSLQSQPQPGTPEDIDNCCFIGWQCNTDEEWVNGYWAYQQNKQCAAPSQQQQQQERQQRQQSGNQQQSQQEQQSRQEPKSEEPPDKEPSGDLIFIRLTEEEWREARCDIYGGSSCDD